MRTKLLPAIITLPSLYYFWITLLEALEPCDQIGCRSKESYAGILCLLLLPALIIYVYSAIAVNVSDKRIRTIHLVVMWLIFGVTLGFDLLVYGLRGALM